MHILPTKHRSHVKQMTLIYAGEEMYRRRHRHEKDADG